jgi:hypothetical protein
VKTALLATSSLFICLAFAAGVAAPPKTAPPRADLQAGFGEADITPKVGGKPVYIAGFGRDRKATKVHDPLKARAVVLRHADRKVALVSLDLVGLFHESTERVRRRLPGFTYVLVSCTHNHEGPDTLGLWSPFKEGVDRDYLKRVEDAADAAVKKAEAALRPAAARLGTAKAPQLLHDSREPYVKHDELVALRLHEPDGARNVGLVVQWNCHPETLDSKNTEVSADFVGYTVAHLERKHGCPVVYLSGTVGGLMTSLHVEVKDENGRKLADGTFEKTERYGRLVGELADAALASAKPLRLTPLAARSRSVFLPVDNKTYQVAWRAGILRREGFLWKGDPYRAAPAGDKPDAKARLCVRSEVALLRLGELDVAAIPGEIYPELVLDRVQDPPDPGADFPTAPIEPAIYKQLRGPHRMLVGLANDELGYIIPKRQWDERPPYCYGRKQAQYGEGNSLGPETAPLLCEAFRQVVIGH